MPPSFERLNLRSAPNAAPSRGVVHLGPFPLRAYALCIIAGIIVGMVIATRRWRARGGTSDGLEAVVVLAVWWGERYLAGNAAAAPRSNPPGIS